jgi:hypothetical protein
MEVLNPSLYYQPKVKPKVPNIPAQQIPSEFHSIVSRDIICGPFYPSLLDT